jgi:diguanylate cyclase (GGDEF)-like protein/PAS domain S-box-containing protein
MLTWQMGLAELIRAFAYLFIALATFRLFRESRTRVLGRRRWFIVLVLLAIVALQFIVFGCQYFGGAVIGGLASLIAAGSLLVIALILWPFLAFVKNRMARDTGKRLKTRLRHARAQAAQSRLWLEMGEAMSHAGHWTVDIPGRELFWSDEIYRINGLDKHVFVPDIDTSLQLFHPDDRPEIRARFLRAIAKKSGFEWEARLLRPDGGTRIVLCRGVVRLNEAGTVARMFGVCIDLTGQKLIEDQLRAANLAAESANHLLRELALADGLTGLPNRRHFDAVLYNEFRRAIREQSGLGMIMIDLDHFKAYNDLYGHQGGDACLRDIAQAITGVPCRPGDLIARYGGEEFVVLLPQTDEAGTEAVARLISEAVTALRITHRGNTLPIATISCGVAVFDPSRDEHVADGLIARADRALYQAKRAGRNQIVRYGGEPATDLAERISNTG